MIISVLCLHNRGMVPMLQTINSALIATGGAELVNGGVYSS